MLHLLARSLELEALIKELQESAKLMDNETSVFHNTTSLIQSYTIEKIRIDEALKIWNKQSTQK